MSDCKVHKITNAHQLQPWISPWLNHFKNNRPIDSSCSFHRLGNDLMHLTGFRKGRCLYILEYQKQLSAIIVVQPEQKTLLNPLKVQFLSCGEHYVSNMLITPNTPNFGLSTLIKAIFTDFPNVKWLEFKRITHDHFGRLSNYLHEFSHPHVINNAGQHSIFELHQLNSCDFDQRLSKKTRNNMNYYYRLLKKEHPNVEFIFQHPTPSDNERLINQFIALEHSGWKGQHGNSIHNNKAATKFHQQLTKSASNVGQLLWAQCLIETRVIAMILVLDRGDQYWALKIAYDETFKRYSPGALLTHQLLHFAIKNTIKQVDMVTDFEWVQRWKPTKKPYYSLRIFRNSLTSKCLQKLIAYKQNGA